MAACGCFYSRPFGVLWLLAAVLSCASPALAQKPEEAKTRRPEPLVETAPSQPEAGARVFGSDAGMIINAIRQDRTADFELVVARIHEALQRSTDPVRRQQAAGWKVYKASEPGPNESALYIFVMAPAVEGADYTISKILNEAFPDEVREIWKQYMAASTGSQSLLNLKLVRDFSAVPTATTAKPSGTTAKPSGIRH